MALPRTFDPLSADFWRDPYPYYELLREEPALYVEKLNAWWVGRYKDVQGIANDPLTYSHAKFQEIGLGEFDFAPNTAQLVASDPPVHTRLRKLANQGFTPRRLKSLDGRIREKATALIEGLAARKDRRFDFMHDLADLLPVNVVAELMGADPARCPDFRRWTRSILSASSRATMNAEQLAGIRRSVDEARAYFKALIAAFKKHPTENIVCDLIAAQEGDDRLTDDEIMALTILLMIGGDETTGHLMGNMLVLLSEHPDQWELLRSEPHRLPDAIDESLRYWAPVQTAFLHAVKDANVDGVSIPAGATVVAVWGCANHDPRHYKDPARFDITRQKQGHLAFGSGPHFCVGNMLARQETITTMQLLLERMPTLRVEHAASIDWFPSYWNRGPRTLPVIF